MLEYDDSAFYYFMIACCTLYLLPATYHIGKTLGWVAFSRKVTVPKVRTSLQLDFVAYNLRARHYLSPFPDSTR